jgi:hypothetical protein
VLKITNKTGDTINWIAYILHINEVLVSNFSPETKYLD